MDSGSPAQTQTFFSLGEVNVAIAELADPAERAAVPQARRLAQSLFETLDRPALRALPAERYQYGEWKTARVNIDYHVEFDQHWYSVPYALTQQQVEIRATASTVEIFHKGVRVASHAAFASVAPAHDHSTDHRPKAHHGTSGVDTFADHRLGAHHRPGNGTSGRQHPGEQSASGAGLPFLPRHHSAGQQVPGAQRVEAAATRALLLNACSYQSIRIDARERSRSAGSTGTGNTTSGIAADSP